jgi:hypothetical protein
VIFDFSKLNALATDLDLGVFAANEQQSSVRIVFDKVSSFV